MRVLELQKLTIRAKINLGEENITKMLASSLHKTIIYLGTSFGVFMVYDSRSTSEFQIKEQLHATGIMDFALTGNEEFVLTSSLDRTINLLKLDPVLMGLKSII